MRASSDSCNNAANYRNGMLELALPLAESASRVASRSAAARRKRLSWRRSPERRALHVGATTTEQGMTLLGARRHWRSHVANVG